MAPRQDLYHPFLGQPYMMKASGDEKALWFERAYEVLQEARRLNPLGPDHRANLGVLYLNRGRATQNAAERVERPETSIDRFLATRRLSSYTERKLAERDLLEAHLTLEKTFEPVGLVERANEVATAALDLATDDNQPELRGYIERLRLSEDSSWPGGGRSSCEPLLTERGPSVPWMMCCPGTEQRLHASALWPPHLEW